jgi:two-component system NtrC family response regulator
MNRKNIKILVIDDDPNMFNLIKFYLSSENYNLYAANNGQTALHLLENDNYDIILLDVLMPEMDGLTFLKQLKSKFISDSLVIMVTAHGPEDHLMESLKEGVYDILQKPFTANRLKLTISNALKFKLLHEAYNRLKNETKQS